MHSTKTLFNAQLESNIVETLTDHIMFLHIMYLTRSCSVSWLPGASNLPGAWVHLG